MTEQTARRIVETTFPVRYAETDQMQIVHHANYIVWMEEGRSEFMRASGADYAEVERRGHLFALPCASTLWRASHCADVDRGTAQPHTQVRL